MGKQGKRIGACVLSAAALAAVPAAAGAATKVVYAGGPVKFQKSLGTGTADDFLIQRVTIRAGDTVDWPAGPRSSGFHTVDIPKLNGTPQALITATGKTVTGENDFAGNPFWFNGKVPVLSFNTQLFGPSGPKAYNGTTRVDSGLPVGKVSDFKVKFLTPGTFKYFCDVHPGMIGYVIVKAKTAAIPTAAQDAAELSKEEKKYSSEIKKLAKTKPAAKTVSMGASAGDGAERLQIFPAKLSVPVGTTVKFSMARKSREVHTASFGPKSYLMSLAASFNGPAPDPKAIYPSDPPGTITLTSTSHGNGFANTGVLDQSAATPTIPPSGTITFTKAGTYTFMCLIHPFMHATVVVS